MRARNSICLLVLATAALALGAMGSASAAIPFCTFGSGPGQCNAPGGVAVDRASGRVYVADSGNNRVDVFSEDGDFISSFGSSGSGTGQFDNPRWIAVDSDPTSPNFHDVFVSDSNLRVQRFGPTGAFELTIGAGELNRNAPISFGPGDDLYALGSTGPGSAVRQVKVFSASGTLVGSSVIGAMFIGDATVDSSGDFYVNRVEGTAPIVEKYELSEPDATLLDSFDFGANTTALAVDSTDHLYAAQGIGQRFITKRDPSGNIVKRFGYGEIEFNLEGLALDADGDLFGSEAYVGSETQGNKIIHITQPSAGASACCLNTTLGNTKATLKGGVNPEGKAATYHFEYIKQADYATNGNSFSGANPATKTPEGAPVGSDFELYPAEAQIGCATPEVPPQPSCLEPNTAYRYRLVAKNADGENSTEAQFTTKAPFEVLETYATEAGTDAVRLHAAVNPLGIPASAFFEYVDDASYQADVEGGGDGFVGAVRVPDVGSGQPPLDIGSGGAPKTVTAQPSGLVPGITYHYRAVASDPFATEAGPERTVTTFPLPKQPANACPNAVFRTGPSALLPDCRAYEMVSPVDKNGGDIKVLVNILNYPARLEQSSTDGNHLAYSSVTAFANALSAPWTSEYLATRGPDGWTTEAINPPRSPQSLTDSPVRFDVQYKRFSDDLSEGWLFHDTDPPLDDCAPAGDINLYRRDNATGDYEALLTAAPPKPLPDEYRIELQGVSADGTHAIFRADAKLTKDAASSSNYQLYMHVKGEGCGELRLVSVEPNGSAFKGNASAGTPSVVAVYRRGGISRAFSADGTRVFFSLAETRPGPLFLRVNADRSQSPVSAGKCTDPEKACTLRITTVDARFWTAGLDGSVAIYSVGDELFEYDVEKALAGEPASTLIAAGLPSSQGVAAASEDASRIYFVSKEEIDGEGEEGEPNLYLYQPNESGSERYRLVATLNATDLASPLHFGFGVGHEDPINNNARTTLDGTNLTFVSAAAPPGYDNTDAADRRPALEVFLYDAETDKLACVSCSPSGARPQGRLFAEGPLLRRVSAMLPTAQSQTFAPRVLSDDGDSLFFESFEALLARDSNGKADVYQWQRASSQAQCEANGAELYVPSSGGCLSLISSGQSPLDTEIADASPDGRNVFIRTAESLLPQDPGNVDIYDVRVGGGFPQPPGQPAACEGEACQGPPAPPSDQTPASLSFQGAGDVKEEANGRARRCPKGKVRAKAKARGKGRCVPRRHRQASTGSKKRH